MKTDIEIAQSVELQPIVDVVKKLASTMTTWNYMVSIRPSSALIRFVRLKKSCRQTDFGNGNQSDPCWRR